MFPEMRSKKLKKIILSAVIVILLAVTAVLIAPGFVDWNAYKDRIEEKVNGFTGHKLEIAGNIRMAVLPSPHLEIAEIKLFSGDGGDAFLKLEKADVRVSVKSLLEGDVVIESINLARPRLVIRIDSEGGANWKSEKLKELIKSKGVKKKAEGNSAKIVEAVSLESVRIQNGSVLYIDDRKGEQYEVINIDMDMKGDSLIGPYKGRGSFEFGQHEVIFKGATGRFDALESVALQLETDFPGFKISSKFSGVISFGSVPEAQGELSVEIADPGKIIKASFLKKSALGDSFSIDGLLTASPSGFLLDNMHAVTESIDLSGKLEIEKAGTGTPVLNAALVSKKSINLDEIIIKSGKARAPSKVILIPETFHLPVNIGGKLSFQAPGITLMNETFSALDFKLSKDDKSVDLLLEIGGGPGDASIDLEAQASFGSVDVIEEKGVVYSDPVLGVNMRIISGNFTGLVTPFLPGDLMQMAALRLYDSVDADIKAIIEPDKISLKESAVKLDNTVFGASGTYFPAKAQGVKDQLGVEITADVFDVNKIIARIKQTREPESPVETGKKPFNIADFIKSLSLPVDLNFDLGAQNVIYGDMQIGGVRVKGSSAGDTFVLDNATINDFFKGQFSAAGKIGNTGKLSDISLVFSGKAKELEAILEALQIDTKALPQPFGSISFNAAVKGEADALGINADVSALKGELKVSGQLTGMLTHPKINNLDLSLEHPNFVEAVRIINPKFNASTGLERPLDFYTKIQRKDSTYTFRELKANIGPMPVMGEIEVITDGDRPLVDGNIRLGTVPLDELLASTDKTGRRNSADNSGANSRWSRNAIDTDWMRSFDMNLSVEARELDYKRWAFINPTTTLNLKDGLLEVPDFRSGLFGGYIGIKGHARSSEDPHSPLGVEGVVDLQGVSVASFAHALSGSRIIKAEGTANLGCEFKTSGISPAAMIFALSGKGDVNAKDFVLKGVDFVRFAEALSEETKPGDTVKGIWTGATRGGQTIFDNINGMFVITEGVVNIDPLVMDGPRVKINSKGNINLPQWTIMLDNKVTLKQKQDLPPFDVKIQGPLDNPGNTLAKGMLEDYLQRKIQRKINEALGSELDGKIEDTLGRALGIPVPERRSDSEQQQQQKSPASNDNRSRPRQNREVRPEEVFEGVIRELIR
jgi:uncharacterized protein involved in outer membrane biogenesis